jgi:NTE family protein
MAKAPQRPRMFGWLANGMGLLRDFAYRDLGIAARRPRIGLALGGGFARGIAHIGVFRELERNNIPIDLISGTSVGALIAAAYASGTPLEEMERQAFLTRFTDFGRWTLSRMGLASNLKLDEFLGRFTSVKNFEDLKIPLAIATTDIVAGKTVYFTRGDLRLAVRASCAYPGLFVPVEIDGQMLVDGFVTDPVPVEGARQLGADLVFSVYLSTISNPEKPRSIIDVIGRAYTIVQQASEPFWRRASNVVIEPDVTTMQWDDFKKTPEMVASGALAVKKALPAIRNAIKCFGEAGGFAARDARRSRRDD